MTQLSKFAQKLTGQPMFKVAAEVRRREVLGQDFIHFEVGDPNFNSPPEAIISAIYHLIHKKTHYAPAAGVVELRQEIAHFYNNRYNLNNKIKYDNVVIAPGCNPLIYCIFKCLLEEGDPVDFPFFAFPTYLEMFKLMNLGKIPISGPDRPKKYPSRLTLYISPSNPVGRCVSEKYLSGTLNLVRKAKGFLLSDEIYSLMTYPLTKHTSILEIDKKLECSAMISGFSKAFSMTGWRVGYMIGPKWLCEKVALMLESIVSCTNTFIQYACIDVLKSHPSPDFIKNMNELLNRRNSIVSMLNATPGITCWQPEGATYAFPDISETGLTSPQFVRLMLEHGVAMLPGTDFTHIEEMGNKYVRLSFASVSINQIEEGCKRIKKALNSKKAISIRKKNAKMALHNKKV